MTETLTRPAEDTDPGHSDDHVARARAIAPLIAAEADAMEELRTLSPTVVQALRDNGLFWVLVPEQFGGAGMELVPSLKVIEELARADGSTAWAVMANAFSTGIAVGYLPEDGVHEMYGGADLGITAGMILPTGKGRVVEGGYRVTGKYSFGSGSAHANWIGAGFVVHDDEGNAMVDENGVPVCRVAFLPREEIDFRGGWDVMGMVATGSDDYVVDDVFVPDRRAMDTFSTVPVRPEPVYRLGLLGIGVGGHGPVALGIAQHALEEIATIAATKARPGYPTVIGDSHMFRRDFMVQEAALQAARSWFYAVHADAEATAVAGQEITEEQRARLRQVTTWVQGVARDVVSFAYNWGGSASIRNPSALGRCLRDISVGAQHLLVEPMTLVDAAAQVLPTYVRRS
jgi:alkylation response protein AidB-like acyl-CoA dehydrogenase